MNRAAASPWPPLLVAVALEVAATLSLRAAEGLTHPAWLILVVAGYAGSLALLAVVLGRVRFHDHLSAMSAVGIVVIVGGVLLVETGSAHP